MISEALFTSGSRIAILKVFLLEGVDMLHIRGFERKIGQPINAVRRELSNLESCGILSHKTINRKKYYHLKSDDQSKKYQSAIRTLLK